MPAIFLRQTIFILLLSFFISGNLFAADMQYKTKIVDFTEAWLELLDKKHYQRAWQLMTPKSKSKLSFNSWVGIIEYNRSKLGDYKRRELNVFHKDRGVKFDSAGSEFFLFYSTAFTKNTVKENICVNSDGKGRLLVDSYVVLGK